MTGGTMTDHAALLRLMTWMSPSFPVGAYTYSHGLEFLVEQGGVHDRDSLRGWLMDVLGHGAGWSDAVLAANAYDAARSGDDALLEECRALGLALNPSSERLLETASQGDAFLRAVRAGWPDALGGQVFEKAGQGTMPYPVAVGAVAAWCGVEKAAVLPAYLHGFAANLISAGVRLVPLGQSDGVRIAAGLEAVLAGIAAQAAAAPLEAIGGFAPLTDIASMKHETQYTRLFRS